MDVASVGVSPFLLLLGFSGFFLGCFLRCFSVFFLLRLSLCSLQIKRGVLAIPLFLRCPFSPAPFSPIFFLGLEVQTSPFAGSGGTVPVFGLQDCCVWFSWISINK